ncbi:YadA-like family protein [uncultured Megasphaera sp.]|uniref:YadA-like family protein n=1 Tax=uncultured Megasphaera sp. TaxID=165188 RepID=UPI0026706043|nr:YadA-like family protein [uncultured Megasphaera sp.]
MAADKDIVKGEGAEIKYDISPANDGTNIAVGKNAKVFIGGGTQESMLSFGEKAERTYKEILGFQIPTGWHIHSNNHAKQNLPESIAVGTNSYARTGSIEIGAHTLAENKISIGDATADQLRQFGVASTTLGTNSYTGGGFATTIGSYNVQSNKYEAKDSDDTLYNATKNAFSTIIGTFNSNESIYTIDKDGRAHENTNYTSGVANMISGTANKVTNSNGAIVMGAGNSVKNSIEWFDTSSYSSLFKSAADMQKALMDGVASSAGGATLVIGGANQAENTSHSQIMGVKNSVKGSSEDAPIQYNYLDGFESSITDASHVKVLGQKVTINKGADSNTVIGDNRTVAEGQTNNVIIGNADETAPITTLNKETVILGYKANASVDGGVALGSGSIANTLAEVFGWDPKTNQQSSTDNKIWKSSWAAVSVGDSTHTRQITNVAAGYEDTDAVNVAQLKAVMENAAPKIDFVAGDGIQIEKDSTGTKYTIKANITGSTTTTDITTVTPKANGSGSSKEEGNSSSTGSSDASGQGKALEVKTETNPIYFAADEGTVAKVKPSETLGILGDKTNISTKVDGANITVSLKKDITVDSVKAGNTTVNNEGVTIVGGPSMTVNGIDAGGKKITNVASGTAASDAVNYGQLRDVENKVDQNTQGIYHMNNRISNLDNRVNKVGAGAAALAALHPLDFDPDDKWDFAVGYGNYRNANSVAFGAFYRPNEDTMFSLGTNFGNGENMFNAGLSFKIGQGSGITTSKTAMAKKIESLEDTVDKQDKKIAELEALVKEQGEMIRQYVGKK